MATRDGPVSRAVRVAADDQRRVIAELARAQRSHGISDSAIGRATGKSRFVVARALAGTRPSTVVELAAIGGAIGLDVRLQAFIAGDAIRDAGQQRLLERFRAQLPDSITWRTEVPLPIPGDRRAWDAVIGAADWRGGLDAETGIDDVQALDRRFTLKARDGGLDLVILLVADTPKNRRALDAAPHAFADLSRNARLTLAALRRGERPPRSALILL